MGSEPTAAGGGRKEASEWPRSARDEGAPSPRTFAGHRNRGACGAISKRGKLFVSRNFDFAFLVKNMDNPFWMADFLFKHFYRKIVFFNFFKDCGSKG